MPITLGDIIQHSNPLFPIVDILDSKGGTRTVETFTDTALSAEFSTKPAIHTTKLSLLIVQDTNSLYYLSGTNPNVTTSWTIVSGGGGGPRGPQGPQGSQGIGIPTGGSSGQVLVKNSDSDYDAVWQTIITGGGGVLQFGASANFPATGSTSTLYIAKDTNEGWFWDGSVYKALGQYDSDLTVTLTGNKTFGKYASGQTIESTGKTPREVIKMAIAEALPPTLTLTVSPTQVTFNQPNINNTINFAHVINTPGATGQSGSVEFNINGGPWTGLTGTTATSGVVTHNTTVSPFSINTFNYRYTVTDTSGGTNTTTRTVTTIPYSPPTISLSVAATTIQTSGTPPQAVETNTTRERGNSSSQISGTITRVPLAQNIVNLVSYTVQYSSNGGPWVDIPAATNVSISGQSATIASFQHDDPSLRTSATIQYRVKVIDQFQTTYSGVTTVTFSNFIYYSPVTSTPTNSAEVRAITSKALAINVTNPFILNTGNTLLTFTAAIPGPSTITEVKDIDAQNQPITTSYILSTFNVNDFAGNPVSYNVYTMTNSVPYTANHRHQIFRN